MSVSQSVSAKSPAAESVEPGRFAQTFVIVSGESPVYTVSAQRSPGKEATVPVTTSVSPPEPSAAVAETTGTETSCQWIEGDQATQPPWSR